MPRLFELPSVTTVPVAGPASVKTLLYFAVGCGVAASTKVMTKYGLSLTRLLGSAGPDSFLADLAERVDPVEHDWVKLHFYPFGGLHKSAQWISDYSAKP